MVEALYSLLVPAETLPVALTVSTISSVPIVVKETTGVLFLMLTAVIEPATIAITRTIIIGIIILLFLLFLTVAIFLTSI